MYFIDSNMWCYYFDVAAKEHSVVVSYLDSLMKKEKLAMNFIVLMEIAHYLVKRLGPIQGKEKMQFFLSYPFVLEDFDYELLIASLDNLYHYSHTGIGGRDATILAAMQALETKKLVTHDQAFQHIPSIDVFDPLNR